MIIEKATTCEYKDRALKVLGLIGNKDPNYEFSWLCNLYLLGPFEPFDSEDFREDVLSELGRINNDCDLKYAADRICKLRPKTKDAIQMIKEYRKSLGTNADKLLMYEIEKAVQKSAKENSHITNQDINRVFKELSTHSWTAAKNADVL